MTRHLVVTTCNAEQWDRYGRAMVATFKRHWPATVPLWLYAEGFSPDGAAMDLEASSSWLRVFKDTYRLPKHVGRANGRYDYRRDAVRFSHKVAAIGAAAEHADCEVLIWIDADTVTHAPVTTGWLDELFPEPAAIAWLDRVGVYPECGFLMFRMPAALEIISRLVKQYTSGAIFGLPETHDSYVIWQVVLDAKRRGEIKVASLSGPRGRECIGHPWIHSELASRMDHLKGSRKDLGHSRKSDLVHHRSEPYWQAIQRGEKPA